MTDTATTEIPTDVPESDTNPVRCPYCDRPFTSLRLRDLHVGEEHAGTMTDAEAERYEEAVDTESDELFVLHLKVVAGLVLTFFAIAYLYVFVLSG